MGNGVEFVGSYFKTPVEVVEKLAIRSEAFRDLCADFAMAYEESKRWQHSSSSDRQERIAEYQELIDSMRLDIERELERLRTAPF